MGQKLANNASGTLAASISTGDTTITLTAGHGSRFPSLSTGEYFYATLADLAENIEIVKVTARNNDILTVVRAQDGTTAKAYQAGALLELRPTRALLQSVAQEASVAILLSGTNSYTGTLSPAPQGYETHQIYWFHFTNTNTSTSTTVNLNGFGAVDLRRHNGSQFAIGEIPTGMAVPFTYTGSQFRSLLASHAYLRDGSLSVTGSLNQGWLTTGGSGTAYTLTPTDALSAYAAGHSYFVIFHTACGANATLQISGLSSPPNLVKRNADGTLSNLAAGDIPTNWRSRVTLLSATQALVETPASGSFSATTLGRDSGDTLTINAGTWTIGANYTATRAAGALGGGDHNLMIQDATFTGDSGGTTSVTCWLDQVKCQGSNPVTAVSGKYLTIFQLGSNTVTNGYGYTSAVVLPASGNITTHRLFHASGPSLSGTGTLTTLIGFAAGNLGHSTKVAHAIGFNADDMTASTTLTAAFRGQVSAGTGKYNLYMDGSAANRFNGDLTIYGATAIPSGGTAGVGYKFSSTANFGIFFGSGAPTLSAAKGSLYLRSDGSGTNNRLYVNTDGGTGWTAVTTVS